MKIHDFSLLILRAFVIILKNLQEKYAEQGYTLVLFGEQKFIGKGVS